MLKRLHSRTRDYGRCLFLSYVSLGIRTCILNFTRRVLQKFLADIETDRVTTNRLYVCVGSKNKKHRRIHRAPSYSLYRVIHHDGAKRKRTKTE